MKAADRDRFCLELRHLSEGEFAVEFHLDDPFLSQDNLFDIKGGDVMVYVNGVRSGDDFELTFDFEGELNTVCDRCLGEMLLPVENTFPLSVRLIDGVSKVDEDDSYLVSRQDAILNLDELLFEFAVLSLPICKVHPEGECNPEVESFFSSQTRSIEDPRWAPLKDWKIEEE